MLTVKEYIELYKKPFEDLNKKEQKLIQEYNKYLIERYPFLTPYNVWTGKLDEDYNYSNTWMDDMPDGWRIAFGDEMLEKLREALLKVPYNPKDNWDVPAVCENDTWLNHYRLCQVKEKYGSLRWYDNGATKEVHDIIHEYEIKSEQTCIACGEPAKYISQGWISPFCEKCAKEIYERNIKRYSENKMTLDEAIKKYPFDEDYKTVEEWFKD